MSNFLWGALSAALSTVLTAAFVLAFTEAGKRFRAWARGYMRHRRRERYLRPIRTEARSAQPGGSRRGWLTCPANDDVTGAAIQIKGRVVDAQVGHDLWIAHRAGIGGEVWPKSKIILNEAGWFEASTLEGGRTPSIMVSLLLLPSNLSQEFDQWAQRGALTGRYPGIVLPASVVELARAAVRIDLSL